MEKGLGLASEVILQVKARILNQSPKTFFCLCDNFKISAEKEKKKTKTNVSGEMNMPHGGQGFCCLIPIRGNGNPEDSCCTSPECRCYFCN